jgi:hypothetical protein
MGRDQSLREMQVDLLVEDPMALDFAEQRRRFERIERFQKKQIFFLGALRLFERFEALDAIEVGFSGKRAPGPSSPHAINLMAFIVHPTWSPALADGQKEKTNKSFMRALGELVARCDARSKEAQVALGEPFLSWGTFSSVADAVWRKDPAALASCERQKVLRDDPAGRAALLQKAFGGDHELLVALREERELAREAAAAQASPKLAAAKAGAAPKARGRRI